MSFSAAEAFISATQGSWRWAQLYSRVVWLLYSSEDGSLLIAYLWICNPVRCVSPLPWELLQRCYLDIFANNWVIFRTHQCCPVMAIMINIFWLKLFFLNQIWIMCSYRGLSLAKQRQWSNPSVSDVGFSWGGQRYNGSQLPHRTVRTWTTAASLPKTAQSCWLHSRKPSVGGQKVQIRACLVQNIPVNDFNGWWWDSMQQFEPLLL